MNNTNYPDKYGSKDPWSPHPHKMKEKWGIEPEPKPITIDALFPNFGRWSIGFDPVFDTLKAIAKEKAATYPPYNITKHKDGIFIIEMAVAGFKRDELDITSEGRTLTVKSKTITLDENKPTVLYQGIAKRAFTNTFAMADHVEVQGANLEDGILTIVLKQELPEELKPKSIEIK
jgi:molecular chaperone IbpA